MSPSSKSATSHFFSPDQFFHACKSMGLSSTMTAHSFLPVMICMAVHAPSGPKCFSEKAPVLPNNAIEKPLVGIGPAAMMGLHGLHLHTFDQKPTYISPNYKVSKLSWLFLHLCPGKIYAKSIILYKINYLQVLKIEN